MEKNEKHIFIVYNATESIYQSFFSDVITFTFIAIFMVLSIDVNLIWTMFLIAMLLIGMLKQVKVDHRKRTIIIKTKEEAMKWAESLE